MTDHRPLKFFLKSSALNEIYAKWASELRCLGIEIKWIEGGCNLVADALLRTKFTDAECDAPPLKDFVELIDEQGENPI